MMSVLTREVILCKIPKRIRIKLIHKSNYHIAHWWYKNLKGHEFNIEPIKNDSKHFRNIESTEHYGCYFLKEHATIIG